MVSNIDISELPLLLSFGSWIGGDRDGNPFVTPQITRDAIGLARGHLLTHYEQQIQLMIDLLTSSAQQLPVSDELSKRLRIVHRCACKATESHIFGERYEFEYYRRYLICVRARLERTVSQPETDNSDALPVTQFTISQFKDSPLSALPPYHSVAEFLDDLAVLRTSLAAESRPAPRSDIGRSAHPAGSHLRSPSAHARHSPACERSSRRAARNIFVELRRGT